MQAARDLGAEMARRNIGLVYGGGARHVQPRGLCWPSTAKQSDKAHCSQEAAV